MTGRGIIRMKHLRFIGSILLLIIAGHARANYRSDFFNASRKPSVSFDKGRFTWTLRNGAVERVIRFDAKAGKLETVAFRMRNGHSLKPVDKGEGEITFVSGVVGPPILLSDWKMTEPAPPANWTAPDYNDGAWKPGSLPDKSSIH